MVLGAAPVFAQISISSVTYCPPLSPTYTGQATYYQPTSPPTGVFACTIPYSFAATVNGSFYDGNFAALDSTDFDNPTQADICGACAQVTYSTTTIVVPIVDNCQCPGGYQPPSDHHLDLSTADFIKLAGGTGAGIIPISWNLVQCPVSLLTNLNNSNPSGNISYYFADGEDSGIYFYDIAFPVAAVTVGGAGLTRSADGRWQAAAAWPTTGSQVFTLTDARGNQVSVTVPLAAGNDPCFSNTLQPSFCAVTNGTAFGTTNAQFPGCNAPTDTPTSTVTATPTKTATATKTATPLPTNTPTSTATASPTHTATMTTTSTASPTPSFTHTATPSSTPSSTASTTPTFSATSTPSASASSTQTPTSTSSWTPSASPTATSTKTSTPSPTASGTPTTTATMTSSFTATSTGQATATNTPTKTATSSATATETDSTTPTSSATLTATPSASPTRTFTPTPTGQATATSTATDSPSSTPTPSPTRTKTPTATFSPTLTGTNTPSGTPTRTETATASFTPTATGQATATQTPTKTPTSTATSTPTATFTLIPPTSTSTPSPSNTPTFTSSFTPTASFTTTTTATSTWTSSPTPLFTSTATATPSSTPAPTLAVVYPNPCDGTQPVKIHIPGLTVPTDLKVQFFTVAFRKVKDQSFPQQPAGVDVSCDLNDPWGKPLASGLYYVVVTDSSPDGSAHRIIVKLLLLR